MNKLTKNTLPENHTVDDFTGFGPVVTADTKWGDSCLVDLGCFKQDLIDTNKFYHLAVVQSKLNQKYYAYFQWGRTKPDGRPNKPAFQFTECLSKQEAMSVCEKQFHSKNTKRGQWKTIGSKERFVAKPSKDVYVVRVTATRLVGLPCVENITNQDAKGDSPVVATKSKKSKKKTSSVDPQTRKLFQDLIGGAVHYTHAMMGGKGTKTTLPAQAALNEGRDVLQDALERIKVVGSDVQDQLNDAELKELSYHLYGVIPKAKSTNATEVDWLLTQNNIATWQLDIDAFETALQSLEIDVEEPDDVMTGIPAKVEWVPKSNPVYDYFVGNYDSRRGHSGWWGNATRYRSGTGNRKLKIHNLWSVVREKEYETFEKNQELIHSEMPKKWNNERPIFNDESRIDLTNDEQKMYSETNTGILFHGTRSVNVPGIVRESFRFPKELKGTGVSIAGAAFGGGTYFADDWSKSAGYCSNPGSYYGGDGAVQGRHSFMFACDVILGNPHLASGSYGYSQPPKGTHCIFAKAGHSGVRNNEWVLFHKGRIQIKYLAEISW